MMRLLATAILMTLASPAMARNADDLPRHRFSSGGVDYTYSVTVKKGYQLIKGWDSLGSDFMFRVGRSRIRGRYGFNYISWPLSARNKPAPTTLAAN